MRKGAVILAVLAMAALAGCQGLAKAKEPAKEEAAGQVQAEQEVREEVPDTEGTEPDAGQDGPAGGQPGTQGILTGGTQEALTGGTQETSAGGTQEALAGEAQEALTGEAQEALAGEKQEASAGGTQKVLTGGAQPGQADPAAGDGNRAKGAPDSPAPSGKKQPPEGWELTLASEDWGLSFGEPGTQSVGNASAEDLAWYDAYYVGDDSEKVIYLTFDCGYENGNTEPILDALEKHKAQATFFVVGHFLETAPEMVKRMVEEGHAVGNHTYHHPDMPAISDRAAFQKELDDVADLFREVTGKELSPYYRPPQGKCNVQNLKMAQELGYHTVFWSLAYVDWNQDDQPTYEEAFDKLTTRVHPGAVVLLHNTSKTNGEILDELLTKWEGMGYRFRPLSDLVLGR